MEILVAKRRFQFSPQWRRERRVLCTALYEDDARHLLEGL